MLRHVTSRYVMLCCVVLCCVILCYVMFFSVLFCSVLLCYFMLCYVMLCYVMFLSHVLALIIQSTQVHGTRYYDCYDSLLSLLLRRGSSKVIKLDVKPLVGLRVQLEVLVTYLLRGQSLFQRLHW